VRARKNGLLMLLLVLGPLSTAMAQRTSHPGAEAPKAIDRGALAAQPDAMPISVTVALKLRNQDDAENLVKSLSTPGDPQYHQFLTADQFVARFGPTPADMAKVATSIAKYGLTVEKGTATTLKVTGSAANLERAFAVSLHSYEVPAHDNVPGYTYHAPLSAATVPDEISASVTAVVGLDSRPSFHSHMKTVPKGLATAKPSVKASSQAGDAPGLWTVTDFAEYYDVEPLYKEGITGKGRTVGIITFASFTPSDAFTYWKAIGVNVATNRLSVVNVDGGPGAPSDASGSDETTLDVEQSGGIAPGAKIIVYQAPNTNQAFVDVFAAATDSNSADSLSISWGSWEWLDNLENSPVANPSTGRTTSILKAAHEQLLRAAIQGQTVFAAAGDGGAYDATDSLGCFPSTNPSCNEPLSVDYPASDTAITAAGGTTLPGLLEYCLNAACTPPYYDVNIPKERVWGWDYLKGLCVAIGEPNPIDCGIFPVGGGGGVSISYLEPLYQAFLPGVQLSQPGQDFVYNGELLYDLPPFYPGRNVPDISFNADPYTGYLLYYTSSADGFEIIPNAGGTSFVAPQLNGVTALLGQSLHGRLGLLNYPLYELVRTGQAYRGSDAPLSAITQGDNWFYRGSNGYNPGAGAGTLDVANFANALRRQY
jgi:kumamolisin